MFYDVGNMYAKEKVNERIAEATEARRARQVERANRAVNGHRNSWWTSLKSRFF